MLKSDSPVEIGLSEIDLLAFQVAALKHDSEKLRKEIDAALVKLCGEVEKMVHHSNSDGGPSGEK